MKLFLQKSYRDVTMKELVNHAGLSKGAFYHYFRSKEDLFREITELFIRMGSEDYSSYPRASLKAFYSHYVSNTVQSFNDLNEFLDLKESDNTSLNFFLIMFEAVNRFPEFLEFELSEYNRAVKEWQEIIHYAKNKGEIATLSSDREIADLFLYCTDGVFIRYVNSDKDSEYGSDLKRAFDSLYRNIALNK